MSPCQCGCGGEPREGRRFIRGHNAWKPLVERFWSKVDKTGDCWTWVACLTPNGYGQVRVDGRLTVAHRVSYEMANGPIPKGLEIDHLCRNRACVKPAHLEAVTPAENQRRGISPAGRNAAKTHCPAGHPYAGDNLIVRMKNSGREGRECRTCTLAQARARYAMRTAAA